MSSRVYERQIELENNSFYALMHQLEEIPRTDITRCVGNGLANHLGLSGEDIVDFYGHFNWHYVKRGDLKSRVKKGLQLLLRQEGWEDSNVIEDSLGMGIRVGDELVCAKFRFVYGKGEIFSFSRYQRRMMERFARKYFSQEEFGQFADIGKNVNYCVKKVLNQDSR